MSDGGWGMLVHGRRAPANAGRKLKEEERAGVWRLHDTSFALRR